MVEPTNLKPRFFSALDIASDTDVEAGMPAQQTTHIEILDGSAGAHDRIAHLCFTGLPGLRERAPPHRFPRQCECAAGPKPRYSPPDQ